MVDVECIIPFKLSSMDRFENLKTILTFLKSIDIKTIVVEQDNFNKVRFDNILFIHNEKPFNKGWGMNCGAMSSNKPYLLFWDADMIVEKQHVISALEMFDEYDVVKPYNANKVCDINGLNTNLFRKSMNFDIVRNSKIRTGCPYGGGIFGIKRDIFVSIGGFPEEFEGWGCEDEAMSTKIKLLTKYHENDNPGYHMFHQRSTYDKAYHNLYNKNVEILNRYNDMSKDDLLNHISKDNIGNKDKYK